MRKGQCDDQVLGFDSVISFSVSGAANRLCTMNPSKQRKMLAYFTQRETYKAMCVPQAQNAIHIGEDSVSEILQVFSKTPTQRGYMY